MKKLISFILILSISFNCWAVAPIMYASQAGAGLKDGTSADNAFDAAGLLNAIDTIPGVYYILGPSQTYTLTGSIGIPSGSANEDTKIIGVTDLSTLEPAFDSDRPAFACGGYSLNTAGGANFLCYENLDVACAHLGRAISGYCGITVINCKVTNAAAGDGIYIENDNGSVLFCEVILSQTTKTCIGVQRYGYAGFNKCSGGSWGVFASLYSTVAFNTIIGSNGYGIYCPSYRNRIFNNTIYDCATGINFTASVSGMFFNNNIVSCDVGMVSAADGVAAYIDYNNFYNNTIDISVNGGSTENNTLKRAHNVAVDPQFTDVGSEDFSVGANLKAIGLAGFPGGMTTGYMDIGAVQRKETKREVSFE